MDAARLQVAWSPWTRCESSFSLLLTPDVPGVFAVAEELLPAGDSAAVSSKRMLAIFHVGMGDDLGRDLGRLFASGSPLRDRMLSGRCYVRYSVLPDLVQREAVFAALDHWLNSSSEQACGIVQSFSDAPRTPCPGPPVAPSTSVDRALHLPEGF